MMFLAVAIDDRREGSWAQPSVYALDRPAFDRFVHQHGPAVHRYLCSRLGSQAAEEALAETFVTAWRARAKYDPSNGSVEAWFLGIATNIIKRMREREQRWLQMCADTAREEAAQVAPDSDDEIAVARADAKQRAAVLAAAMAKLAPREREPLFLHAVQELSYEQIAESLGVPIGTVRSRISRARGRLERELRKGGLR